MTPVVKSARLSTGVTLPYVEQGDRSGIPVLFLHGVTDSLHSFDLVLPHLSGRIRAFAMTQRGHGDADRPSDYRAADFAADVPAFLDAVGVASAVVVGHSMGGTNAQRAAIDHPARVRALVLAGSFAGYRDKPEFVDFAQVVAALSDPIDPSFVREFQETTLARPVAPAYLDLVVRERRRVQDGAETNPRAHPRPVGGPRRVCLPGRSGRAPGGDRRLALDRLRRRRPRAPLGRAEAFCGRCRGVCRALIGPRSTRRSGGCGVP